MKKNLLLSCILNLGRLTVSAAYKKGDIIDFTPTIQGEVLSVNGTNIKTDLYANPNNKPSGSIVIPYSYSLPSGETATPIQIAAQGFKQCPITSMKIGAGIEYIGKDAFYGCTQLTSFTEETPGSVKSIGEYAFYHTNALEKISFPGCYTVNEWAFNYSGIKSADFTDIEYIYGAAFYECANLTTFTGGEKLKLVGNIAFCKDEKLTGILLGPNLKSIGSMAFAFCTSIKDIIIPENCSSVDKDAFSGISLNRVFILCPEFMTYCDQSKLLRDKAIETIYCPDSMMGVIRNYIQFGTNDNPPEFLASQATVLPLSDLVELKQIEDDTFQADIKYGDISAIRVFNPETDKEYTPARDYVYTIPSNSVGLQYRVDWKNLLRYTVELDRSSEIEEITSEINSGEIRYYNLQGMEISRPEKGIFIVKQNGKTKKVIL
ncbi:MAG: leucine-rich repeat domain-containing protein [Muribaculaceae bacterium]|nr:leucine-rich repeat domain-containing protein [Muribaculaceae bacterium]